MEIPLSVQSQDKVCLHGISLRFDCYQCAFDKAKQEQPGVCSHWIPKNQPCSACHRLKYRENPFTQRPHIPVSNPSHLSYNPYSLQSNLAYRTKSDSNSNSNSNFMTSSMTPSMTGYVSPGESKQDFPQPVNTVGGGPYHPPTDPRRSSMSSREQPHRAQYGMSNVGVFMERSLEQSNFVQHQNKNQMWGNPILQQNFPSPLEEKFEHSEPIPYMGISSRSSKKIDSKNNEDFFINRSLIQPDMRRGNRFYEIMPSSGRKEPLRNSDNGRVDQFQQQQASMFQQMDYATAFQKGAGMGRAGQIAPSMSYDS